MKYQLGANILIQHITQIASIVLAWIWFGWRMLLVVFLINWCINSTQKQAKLTDREIIKRM